MAALLATASCTASSVETNATKSSLIKGSTALLERSKSMMPMIVIVEFNVASDFDQAFAAFKEKQMADSKPYSKHEFLESKAYNDLLNEIKGAVDAVFPVGKLDDSQVRTTYSTVPVAVVEVQNRRSLSRIMKHEKVKAVHLPQEYSINPKSPDDDGCPPRPRCLTLY